MQPLMRILGCMSESSGHRSCQCGAVYDRSEHIVAERDIRSFECAVYGATLEDIERAFSAFGTDRPDALVVLTEQRNTTGEGKPVRRWRWNCASSPRMCNLAERALPT